MIAHDSKSYPYLAIAQAYKVDYGEVLKFVDSLDINRFPANLNDWQQEARLTWNNICGWKR